MDFVLNTIAMLPYYKYPLFEHAAFSTKCCVRLATLNQGTPGTKHAGHVRPQNYNIHSHSKSTLNSAVVALPSSLPAPWFNQNTV